MINFSTLPRFLFHSQFSVMTIAVLFLLLVVWNLGSFPLFDVDEGAFSEATREMLASGIFSATYLDGVPRYDKPILIYWFQALSVFFLGINEFAFRLPSVIFAALWLVIFAQFTKEFLGKKRAYIGTLSLLGCILFPLVARAAFADALLNLLLTLTLFDIYRYSQQCSQTYICRVFFWMGLGMLTKGPIAIVIPLIVSGLYFSIQGQIRPLFKAYFNVKGWLIFIIVLVPWLWMVYQQQGLDFFKGFLLDHNLNRFTQTKEGHGGHWFYYLIAFPLITLPFGVLIGHLIAAIKKRRRSNFTLFMVLWLLVFIVVFSFSETQLPHYVMNAAVPFILLFTKNLSVLRYSNRVLWVPIGFFALLIAVPFAVPFINIKAPFYVEEMLQPISQVFDLHFYLWSLCLWVLASFVAVLSTIPTWTRLIWVSVLFSLFVYQCFLPRFAILQQAPVKQAAILAKEAGADVVRWRITMPSFSVYREAITPLTLPQAGQWVFTRAGQETELATTLSPLVVSTEFAQGGVRLLSVTHPVNVNLVNP